MAFAFVGELKCAPGSRPLEMLTYGDRCGGHLDIVISSKGPGDYRCPACGKVQTFDLEAFVNKGDCAGPEDGQQETLTPIKPTGTVAEIMRIGYITRGSDGRQICAFGSSDVRVAACCQGRLQPMSEGQTLKAEIENIELRKGRK